MTTTFPPPKHIAMSPTSDKVRSWFSQANNLLRAELGMARSTLREDHPYDLRHQALVQQLLDTPLPLFRWGWSEDTDFRHPMRLIHPDGAKKYDYKCSCGLNVRDEDHAPDCSRGAVALPAYQIRRILDPDCYRDFNGNTIHNSWVLWRWLPPPSRTDWESEFGTTLSYDHYKSGTYEPCSSPKAGPDGLTVYFCVTYPDACALDRSAIHTFTKFCIESYKARQDQASRVLSPSGSLAAMENARQQRVKELADDLTDTFTTGWGKHQHVPGRKGSGERFPISFPGKPSPDMVDKPN